VRAKDLLKTLLDRGVFASINQALDVPTATTLAEAFSGVVSVVSFEEEMVLEVAKEETRENLKPRPPVVTVMGHVDTARPVCSTPFAKPTLPRAKPAESRSISARTKSW